MLKKIKSFHPQALIGDDHFRTYVESFESELLRGISTVAVLQIIKRYPNEGIYGYQLLKELEEETNNVLIIEEGTLYPLLRKMEKDGLLVSTKKQLSGRSRNYYTYVFYGDTDGRWFFITFLVASWWWHCKSAYGCTGFYGIFSVVQRMELSFT